MEGYQIANLIEELMILVGVVAVAWSPFPRLIGQAIAHRIGGKSAPARPAAADERQVEAMAEEITMLRRQLDETLDRLDFTERVVAQQRARDALPGGGAG